MRPLDPRLLTYARVTRKFLVASVIIGTAIALLAVVQAFALAGIIYLVGGMLLTMAVNVPMNRELASLHLPADPAELARIWNDYSAPWQFWNQIRTVASGTALFLCGAGLIIMQSPGARG